MRITQSNKTIDRKYLEHVLVVIMFLMLLEIILRNLDPLMLIYYFWYPNI